MGGITPDLDRALRSLEGLSVGDAFGNRVGAWAGHTPRGLPPGPWSWTDDTHMALSIVEVLDAHGHIAQDALAAAFARRFKEQPWRGYAGGATRLLVQLGEGVPWKHAAAMLFDGGSYGNGGAMRAAPIGGSFWRDPHRAAEQAARAAEVTHAHPEGKAGAMAVAAAAAIAAAAAPPEGTDFLEAVLAFVPESLTSQRIVESLMVPADHLQDAVAQLGNGQQVTAQDTVPFCLWSAAHHLRDFADAMWWTVRAGGDSDTHCAIVGGIVALSSGGAPAEWINSREPLR